MTQTVPDVFDLCVLGCGPAGFAGAMRALDFGKHICIIEGAEIGGAGIMRGAHGLKDHVGTGKGLRHCQQTGQGISGGGPVGRL